MLRSARALRGLDIVATDGPIGDVHDILFDSEDWIVRYLVVDTGRWLPGRKVVLSPDALQRPDIDEDRFPVALTRQQVKESPDLEFHKPVSRQKEAALRDHYGWPHYWEPYPSALAPPRMVARTPPLGEADATEASPMDETHLRSTREIENYRLAAADGELGHLSDFLIDDEDWRIRYLVADTTQWLPGRTVLIAQQWLTGVDWDGKRVTVDLHKEDIRKSPPYVGDVDRSYEQYLFTHYNRPVYWL